MPRLELLLGALLAFVERLEREIRPGLLRFDAKTPFAKVVWRIVEDYLLFCLTERHRDEEKAYASLAVPHVRLETHTRPSISNKAMVPWGATTRSLPLLTWPIVFSGAPFTMAGP